MRNTHSLTHTDTASASMRLKQTVVVSMWKKIIYEMIWNIVVRRDPILLFFSSLYVSFEFRFEFLCMCVYTLLILLFASLFNVKTHTHTRKHTHSRFLSAFMRCFIYNHTIYRGVRTVFARSSVFSDLILFVMKLKCFTPFYRNDFSPEKFFCSWWQFLTIGWWKKEFIV